MEEDPFFVLRIETVDNLLLVEVEVGLVEARLSPVPLVVPLIEWVELGTEAKAEFFGLAVVLV